MGFFKHLGLSKVFQLPCLAAWGGMSIISSVLLLPLLPGKAIASTHGPLALWQSLWLGCHKFFAGLNVLGLTSLAAVVLLILGWGMFFCWCLNYGLGQKADTFLPHFQPAWPRTIGLWAMRSVVALFALGTGILLFVIPTLLVMAAISFWPDALMTGILVLILWTIICVVYIFPCIWADVLIVCHCPIPAQWPSDELYHRF